MDRHNFRACAVVLMILAGSGISKIQAAEPATVSPIKWHTDLQAAHRESVRLNRPMLIVFGAEWCHFCHKLEQNSLGHPQVAQYINQTYIPVHLDFDQAKREAKILNIKSIPCVVALTPQADLVGRVDGFVSPQKIADMLIGATKLQSQIQQARYSQTARR